MMPCDGIMGARGPRRSDPGRASRSLGAPGRWPGQVIAMAVGPVPTVIGGPAVLVVVRIGVTESTPPVTYAVLPSGVIAMPKGSFPTVTGGRRCWWRSGSV